MTLSRVRLTALLIMLLVTPPVFAETYVAGFFGMTFPRSLTDVNLMAPNDTRLSDLGLSNSLVHGARIGHYSHSTRWLGGETEIFRSSPNLRQQSMTTTTVATGATAVAVEPGAALTVTTWAVNLVVRYPGQHLQPYVGFGPALFFAELRSDSPGSTFGEAQAMNVGLNTQVGLRYLWNSKVSVFAEWKYNHARLSFDSFPNASYNAHHLVFGLGYHF
jgi:Outer membrane protein beta-barrel domain